MKFGVVLKGYKFFAYIKHMMVSYLRKKYNYQKL